MKHAKKESRWAYWFTLGFALIVIYKILDNFTGIGTWINGFSKVVRPFLFALLLAYLVYIPCRKIEKTYKKIGLFKNHARGFAVATTYLLVVLFIVVLSNILFPMLSESVIDLANQLPGYYDEVIKYVDNLPEDSIISKEMVHERINNLKKIDLVETFSLDNIAMYIQGVIGIASGLFSAFVTVVVSVYILMERTEIICFIRRLNSSLFSEKKCEKLNRYFIKGNEIFFKYISSQVLDAILVGIVMSVALLVMKVKYAVLLGFIIGLFNLIPYFGAIVAVIIVTLITMFTGGLTQAIWVVIVLVILQQIDANIINPKIVGDALEISKILIIFAVTVGGAYFSVLGMFLGVPVAAVLKMIIDDFVNQNENKKMSVES